MSKEKLVVIDGHALIHRAYHAIPPLTTKDGQVVNAVYGFAVILLNVIRDLKPKYTTITLNIKPPEKPLQMILSLKLAWSEI
jgi:DNA polymerase I